MKVSLRYSFFTEHTARKAICSLYLLNYLNVTEYFTLLSCVVDGYLIITTVIKIPKYWVLIQKILFPEFA